VMVTGVTMWPLVNFPRGWDCQFRARELTVQFPNGVCEPLRHHTPKGGQVLPQVH
jgi:hypothetical protein